MDFIKAIADMVMHLDKHLDYVIRNFGSWSYLILFGIIFCETGLVVTPFLPGDSLLFVVGAFSALGSLKVWWVFFILSGAAIIGDSVNYAIGKAIGEGLIAKGGSRFFKKEYVERTHKFYEKYGGKTIIIARFVPIVRTFAPFVAGVGEMTYYKFLFYNVTGGLLWVAVFLFGGYFLGNIPVVKDNFSVAIYLIIIVSVIPVAVEFWRHRKRK